MRGGEGNPGASGPSNDDGTHAPMEDGVKDTTIDDARLAALLDGRLDAAEREDLLARLSESDDDYLVFADAAAILREREGIEAIPAPETDEEDEPAPQRIAVPEIASAPAAERDADPGVIPMRSRFTAEPAEPPAVEAAEAAEPDVIPLRPRRRFPLAAWGAIAAVLVGVALIPLLRKRGDPYDPARLAASVEGPGALPEAEWGSNLVFRITRGEGGPNVTDEARSSRLGALAVDLEVAARTRDTAAAQLARSTRTLLGDVRGAGSTEEIFREIEQKSGAAPEQLLPLVKQGRESMEGIPIQEYFQAGAWSEAARLASLRRNADFFRTTASRRALEKIPSLAPATREHVEAVRAALPADGAPDWPALDAHLAKIVNSLGG